MSSPLMTHHKFIFSLLAVGLIIIAFVHCPAQETRTLRIAELNCENLFDTIHDEGFDDHDFLPTSQRKWNTSRYRNKINRIAKELMSLSPTLPPQLIALVEVENDSVLRDITRRTPLRSLGYKYFITNSNDHRGIDVALLYMDTGFKPIAHHSLCWSTRLGTDRPTRDMLHIEGIISNGDTLHVMVCHAPSKLGGKKALRLRSTIAKATRAYIDSIISATPTANIIILGDFNDTPNSPTITRDLGALTSFPAPPTPLHTISPRSLYNLAAHPHAPKHIGGTYRYRGNWEMLDHCIVSGHLLATESTLHVAKSALSIIAHPFLLSGDKNHDGVMPFRTYRGPIYQGGFSDHLPILIDLEYTLHATQ